VTSSGRARHRTSAESSGSVSYDGGHRSGGPRRGVGPVPPRLQLKEATVGKAGDSFEQEADKAAEQIVQGKAAPPVSAVDEQALQRQETAKSISPEEIEQGGGVVQRLFDEEQAEEPVQAKSGGGHTPRTVDVPSPGAGSPLAPATRGALESGLGADLGGVRVHDDAAARDTTDRMGAKAFTQGQDISLGTGQSADDVGLLAHEAAHVVQQSGGSGSVAQRQPATPPPAGGAPAAAPPAGATPTLTQKTLADGSEIDSGAKKVTLSSIPLPKSKKAKTEEQKVTDVPIGRPRGKTKQKKNWQDAVKGSSSLTTAVTALLTNPDVEKTKDDAGQFYLVNDKAPQNPVIVTTETLPELAVKPVWDAKGEPTRFQIDHVVEYQLGGSDETADNLWLLEEQANMSSGSQIEKQLSDRFEGVFAKATKEGVANVPADKEAARAASWKFSVKAVDDKPLALAGREDSNWGVQQAKDGEPLKVLRAMTGEEMKKAGGTADRIALFLGPRGGARAEVEWGTTKAPGGVRQAPHDDWWFYLNSRGAGKAHNNYRVKEVQFDPATGGKVIGELFKEDKKGGTGLHPVNQDIDIKRQQKIEWAGFLDKERFINEARTKISFEGMSPIELDDTDLTAEKGMVARGRLLPTIPLIDKAEIDVVIDGDNVYLSKVFTSDDFTFPGPIKVGECSLELRFGLKGFQILGAAAFEIEGLGHGRVYAAAGANTSEVSFALGGEFDFLSDLFEPARVEVWYKDGELGGKGVLGIKEGKIKGLKSAQVTVDWGKDGIKANGTFATTIPGVESGTLSFAYKEDGTVELGGTLSLGSKVPGISSGSIEAQLVRDPEGGWKVFGKIQATPSIPGVASQVTGTYDNGAIQVETTVAYARGMAAGQFTIGLTNRPLDPAGKPAGEPGADLAAYGGGQVALTLAPWLKATAGLRLLPSGEIEVSGQIGLPSALEIFARKSLDKELFKVGIDIPIIGISVAGANIGIFATIAGGASLTAYFGPAELKDLSLGITWNPDHEDQTTVKGHAGLHLPAGAGIRLTISAALGAGIPVVEARLGLEIGGTLGIEAAVGAGVDIDWTPTKGLVLDSVASAYAEPVFTFDVTGFARVDLDLWLKTINLWEKRWQLAAFEYGSGLRLGLSLPVHYEEGKPFEPSLSDVTFEVPSIDPKALLSGLVDRVT
jgi:hypothetical protein